MKFRVAKWTPLSEIPREDREFRIGERVLVLFESGGTFIGDVLAFDGKLYELYNRERKITVSKENVVCHTEYGEFVPGAEE